MWVIGWGSGAGLALPFPGRTLRLKHLPALGKESCKVQPAPWLEHPRETEMMSLQVPVCV